jgi:maleate isomerase
MRKSNMLDTIARPTEGNWDRLQADLGSGPGARLSLGLVTLATDRVGEPDTKDFLSGLEGVEVFTTRVPMSPVATPESLAAMAPHLEAAARLLVPGSRLDVIGFSCTSGTVAIGCGEVAQAIRRARPGIAVTTPIEAGAEGLRRLGCRRISLLVPYRPATADLVSGFFEDQGFTIDRRATFDLDGDPDMNRVTPEDLITAGTRIVHADSDALFISCTGLPTAGVVAALEQAIGRPVVTSNQALAWHALRLADVEDRLTGRGRLFETA